MQGPPPESQQVVIKPLFGKGETANHSLYTWQITDKVVSLWSMQLRELNEEQYTDLQQLYHSFIRGPIVPFTFTHTDGKVYPNVRWFDDQFNGQRRNKSEFEVSLTLRVEDVIVGLPTARAVI